ncbi:adenylate/guanylate cyclase domain-containing protein [Desulfococcaceae bacterium HSG9]|nr:adenylate/guanylate cyclase domain-containing protein [Desulfococcaceae bacterium HSG9]
MPKFCLKPVRLKNKLTFRLVLSIFLCSIVITIIITAIQLYSDYRREMKSIEQIKEQIGTSYVPALINQLWVGDFDIIKVQLKGILRFPYIRYAEIRSEDNQSLFAGTSKKNRVIIHDFPLRYTYENTEYFLGRLYLEMDVEDLYRTLADKLLLILINQSVVIFLISIFIFMIFQKTVMRYLQAIAKYTRALDIENLTYPLELQRTVRSQEPDELGDVVNGINEMRQNLLNETRKIITMNRAFVKFVPQDFLNHLNKQSIADVSLGDSTEGSMSILFTDIRSFTSLSESMTPEESFQFLNNFFSRMGPIIREHNGFIDKYIGDAIMALFDREPDDAVKTGIEMLNQLLLHNKHSTSFPISMGPINMGIGIHKGNLILGTIGEINRMETTVISDAVNLASRLEGMTKIYGVPLIISGSIYDNLKNPEKFAIRLIDRVQAKGKKEPVTIYEVYNSDTPEHYDKKAAIQDDFEQAVKYYQNKEFEYAKNVFERCREIFNEDKVTHIYLKRCDHFINAGVDDNWDGVTRLYQK